MQGTAELYLKGCATRLTAGNTLRERELRAEGSVLREPECSLMGRGVSAARKGQLEDAAVGDPFGHKH
jgi:hypothetical protein